MSESPLPEKWWRDPELFRAEYEAAGQTYAKMAYRHGGSPSTYQKWGQRHGLPPQAPGPKGLTTAPAPDDALLRLAQSVAPPPLPRPPLRGEAGLLRLFFIGDPHRPYHDKQAWGVMLDALDAFKPDVFVSMGDFADFFAVSAHSKDPRRALRLDEEIDDVSAALTEIEERTVGARRIYLGGNHEDRMQRYLQDKAPELFAFIDVPGLLRLREREWEYVPYKQSTRIGKLHLTHDVGNTGRYAIFRSLDTFQSPIITAHTHRLAYIVEGDATGETHVAASFGWLGDVTQVDYMHRVKAMKDWALGFGYGYLDESTGYAYLVPVPIVNGTAVVEGRLHGKVAA